MTKTFGSRTHLTERDPLLDSPHQLPRPGTPAAPIASTVEEEKRYVGPLEIPHSTRWGILAGVWTATFLCSLNTTLVATLLSSISSEFKRSNQASWLGTSYLLATCTFTPLYGRLCNVLGRRGANQTAVLFAAIGTLACGLSKNMEQLILARFVSGLGGGGVFTTSTIIVSDMYSMRSRGLTQGVANIFAGLGMGLGGPIGGFISDHFGWRWAFLLQTPLFVISLALTQANLYYVTPGRGKSTKDVLKRIDYGGTVTLFLAVLSFLCFLSNKYNDENDWDVPKVYIPFALSLGFSAAFVLVELLVSPEPVLAPFLLRQKVPVLIGTQNFLVAACNFAVMYFFPMWFETVALTSASAAGWHLLPNCISMSLGSLFAGWMMHRTGKYKMMNLIFGILPFIAAVSISRMHVDSGWVQKWFSIAPLGFGNAVVLQTTLIALLAHIPRSVMAVGTGFGQLFRGIGQVGGVGIASAIFQSILDRELRKRLHDIPDADHVIRSIRHESKLVATLPPMLQREAQESYAIALRAVFIFASVSTLLAFLIRLPLPEKSLDEVDGTETLAKPAVTQTDSAAERGTATAVEAFAPQWPPHKDTHDPEHADGTAPQRVPDGQRDESTLESYVEEVESGEVSDERAEGDTVAPLRRRYILRPRRLSTYTANIGVMDLEDDVIGGSARSF